MASPAATPARGSGSPPSSGTTQRSTEAPMAATTGTTTTRATAPPRPTTKAGGWDPPWGGTAGVPAATAPIQDELRPRLQHLLPLRQRGEGEVHEEQAGRGDGGDGRRLRRGPRHHAPQQQLHVRAETQRLAAKNRIQHPSNVLHFFNAPLEVTEDNFYEICDELGVKRPSSVKVFSGKTAGLRKGHSSAGERSSSGLLEWESKSDALETLGFLNHYQMKNPSKWPRGGQSSPHLAFI
uniref:Heterogeneous nuclear ribonucleoprotein L RRM domain-containing protein n=1 Tax=Anas platyrhynchos platyrhynchos TaxID=8840 RepID=A0A493TG16_ANAPP